MTVILCDARLCTAVKTIITYLIFCYRIETPTAGKSSTANDPKGLSCFTCSRNKENDYKTCIVRLHDYLHDNY